jgi:hypothetical protein
MSAPPPYTGLGDAQTTSSELVQSNVDFFNDSSLLTDSIIARHIERIPPTSDLANSWTPIQFEIKSAGVHYIDTNDIRLTGAFSVSKADGTALAATDRVGLINNAAHGMIDRVEVLVEGTLQVEFGTQRYPYKSYIEQLFTYEEGYQNHTKPLALWCMDTAGKYEDTSDANLGFKHRKAIIEDNNEVEFDIPLLIDIFAIDKLWPNASSIVLRLHRSPPEFFLMSLVDNESYKYAYARMLLKTPKVTLHPMLQQANEVALLTKNFFYNQDKTRILEFTIKQGQTQVEFNDIWTGLIPKYFLVMMVETSALTGNLKKNPFYFPHNNVSRIYAKINGNMIPSHPYEFDFTKTPGKCIEGYAALYDEIGIKRAAKQHYITLDQFKDGAFILPFPTCADGCFGRHNHPEQSGTISLHMQFSGDGGLKKAFTLLVFCSWADYFEIDAARRVILSSGRPIP